MGERNSTLFGKLTLRSKRRPVPIAATISSPSQSNSSPATTPEAETPNSFSGPADYGLGYSSINHAHSANYRGNRKSRMPAAHPIEPDAFADTKAGSDWKKSSTSRSLHRLNKLYVPHADEEPLFVPIVHEAFPTHIVQSTVRARSSSSALAQVASSSPKATSELARPQSPFAITSSASQSRFSTVPARIVARRCYSANDSEVVDRPPLYEVAVDRGVAPSEPSTFYAVGRGWKKGIYTTKEEAQRQVRNFPGPLLQEFRDRVEAERFLANAGRFTSQPTKDADSEDELAERTRIFTGLDPNSELARRRSISMSVERKEAQRKSRMHIAMHSPVLRQNAAFNSPPLSLRSVFSENPPVSPVSPNEQSNGTGTFPSTSPLQGMSLLPVKDLASSMAFYTRVLGFSCISQTQDLQAVMTSSSATLCLRSVHQAPPPTTASSASRMSMIHTADSGRNNPFGNGSAALPPTPEEQNEEAESAWLPPSPESMILSRTEPEPLKLPTTPMPLRSAASALSAATVLIECSDLEAMHTLLTARFNDWRLAHARAPQPPSAKGTQRLADSAKMLGGVQQTPWDAQELHLRDLDGHRIIYTTPFRRTTTEASLI